MDEQRSGGDRRADEITHRQLWDKINELEQKMEAKIEALSFPEDWEETLRDVAAVARTGRLIKRIIAWGAPLAAALVAAWHYITNTQTPPGG